MSNVIMYLYVYFILWINVKSVIVSVNNQKIHRLFL